jgi:hypothetical protein
VCVCVCVCVFDVLAHEPCVCTSDSSASFFFGRMDVLRFLNEHCARSVVAAVFFALVYFRNHPMIFLVAGEFTVRLRPFGQLARIGRVFALLAWLDQRSYG